MASEMRRLELCRAVRIQNAQQKICGRELFVAACDLVLFCDKRKQSDGTSKVAIPHFRLSCQKIHEPPVSEKPRSTSGNGSDERKRVYPVAMIRRLVNGFVHDLRLHNFTLFLSEADGLLSTSPFVFVAAPAQETEQSVSPDERERVWKSIHHLHVARYSRVEDEFETVAPASRLPSADGRSNVIRVSKEATLTSSLAGNASQNCGKR